MAKTYLDQIVEYPAKVIGKIAGDKTCVGLLVNKQFDKVTEEDFDTVLDEQVFDYQYVDETTSKSTAYIWVEMEVDSVFNHQFKNTHLYVDVCCHKNYMKLAPAIFKGMMGNRRDNLVRYIDKLLNNTDFLGLGPLKLESVKTLSPINGFVARQLIYSVPDFNIVDITE